MRLVYTSSPGRITFPRLVPGLVLSANVNFPGMTNIRFDGLPTNVAVEN
jgi:hypothetical protein